MLVFAKRIVGTHRNCADALLNWFSEFFVENMGSLQKEWRETKAMKRRPKCRRERAIWQIANRRVAGYSGGRAPRAQVRHWRTRPPFSIDSRRATQPDDRRLAAASESLDFHVE